MASDSPREHAGDRRERRPASMPPLVWESSLVGVADIRADQNQVRHGHLPHIEELAASIGRHGLLHPVLVEHHTGEPGLTLISGHRRLEAARRLGWQEIPAYVLDGRNAAERLSVTIIENIQRENLTGADWRAAYLELRRLMNGGTKAAAQLLGIHPASFRRAIRAAGEDGVRRLSIGQSVRALEHWAAAAGTLEEAKRCLLLQKATELVIALRTQNQSDPRSLSSD